VVSAPRACLLGSQLFAGSTLNAAGGAVLLPGFHIADEIVRRASPLAHGVSPSSEVRSYGKVTPGVLRSP